MSDRWVWLLLTMMGCLACASPRVITTAKSDVKKGAVYHFLVGDLYALQDHPTEALREVDKAILDEPSSYLQYKRASLLGALGRLEEADQAARAALAENPRDFAILLLLGKVDQSLGRRAEAIPFYERALVIQPDSEEANLLLMESYLADKKYQAALQLVHRWGELSPEDPTPYFYEASIYDDLLQDRPKAVAAYEKILSIDPINQKALSALAEIYLALKQDQKASGLFLELERQAPGDVAVQLRLALLYYESKQYDQAIEKFKQILQSYPTFDRVHYYLGITCEQLKRDEEAMGQFAKILPRSQFFRDALLHQAYVRHRQRRTAEALEILKNGIRQKRDEEAFYEYAADLLRQQGQWPDAAALLQQGLSHTEDKESLYYALGALYDKMGRFDEAIEQMQKVLRLNPKNANAMNFIGYSYTDRGVKLSEALNLLETAHRLKPNDGFIVDSLGWAYFKMGKIDQARTFLLKAYQLVPKEATITEHLGDFYLALKDPNKALNYFREAIEILQDKKDEPNVQQDVERLKKKTAAVHPHAA